MTTPLQRRGWPYLMVGLIAANTAMAQTQSVVETYDEFPEGWFLRWGFALYAAEGGNPGPHAWMTLQPTEGRMFEYRAREAGLFNGDYAAAVSVRFAIDLKVDSLRSVGSGTEFPQRLWMILINDALDAGAAVALTEMQAGQDWHTVALRFDPRAIALPDGWIGVGAAEPGLPAGVTFRDVLSSVDELRLTTLPPGAVTLGHGFDLRVDNLSIARFGETVFADDFESGG